MRSDFQEIKGRLGFGLMRLPMTGEAVDLEQTARMVDAFMAAGFNYFDTAHPYLQGASEDAVRHCISSRYPRESFVLTNKLSGNCFETAEQIRPLFARQLEKCGVEYFDFYLHHALNAKRHQAYTETGAYEVVKQLREEGKIRHIGMSFHDTAQVLEQILTDRPEIEVVQLQLNYVDWEDNRVQSRKCYEVCRRFGKPVLVMEPVKGGNLANLPDQAAQLLPGSPAKFALRFAAGLEQVLVVLSGMSQQQQMEENLRTFQSLKPLSDDEQQLLGQVRTIYQGQHRIPCTGCRYCVEGCPAQITIPDVFEAFNSTKQETPGAQERFEQLKKTAAGCLNCHKCEKICPQFLQIPQLLKALTE